SASNDGGATEDAMVDAAGPSPCATPHRFCDDFETPALSKWDKIDGTVTIVPRPEGGHMLATDMPAGPAVGRAYATVALGTSGKVRASFDARITDPKYPQPSSANANYRLVALAFTGATGTITASIYMSPTGSAQLTYQQPLFGSNGSKKLDYGVWHHVEIV